MARRGGANEDLSNVEFETSEDVEVVPTFNSMVSESIGFLVSVRYGDRFAVCALVYKLNRCHSLCDIFADMDFYYCSLTGTSRGIIESNLRIWYVNYMNFV